jgi:hypothetical protein
MKFVQKMSALSGFRSICADFKENDGNEQEANIGCRPEMQPYRSTFTPNSALLVEGRDCYEVSRCSNQNDMSAVTSPVMRWRE